MPPMTDDEIKALQTERDTMKAELEKLKAAKPKEEETPAKKPDEDPDLMKKAADQKTADDLKKSQTKALEVAIRFEMQAPEFLKNNEALLPKDVADIFKAAEKENWNSQVEKDAAIKAGIIKSFFQVQTNVDLLTPGLKVALEDWLKLTNNGRQEKAQSMYDSVFEPAFALLKGQKKAEQLGKGEKTVDDADKAYIKKLMAEARNHYLGEKNVT